MYWKEWQLCFPLKGTTLRTLNDIAFIVLLQIQKRILTVRQIHQAWLQLLRVKARLPYHQGISGGKKMVVLCLCCFPYPSPMLWGTVQWVPPELRNDCYLCERRSSEDLDGIQYFWLLKKWPWAGTRICWYFFLFFSVNQGFVLVTFQ